MLQKFGEHIRGWIAKIVIFFIALAFVAWGLEYYIDRNQGAAQAVAVVNGEKITQQAFTAQVQLAQRQQEKMMGRALSDKELLMLKKMRLNQLISQLILVQAARKDGFSVSVDAVKQSIETLPMLQTNGQFDPRRFEQLLINSGFNSPDAFYSYAADNAVIEQLVNGVRDSSFVTPKQAQDAYALSHQQRDFEYAILPVAPLEKNIQVSSKQIKQYYDLHQSQFAIPEKVQLDYLLLSRDSLGKQADVSDAELRSYYESNQANFMVPESWNISRVTAKTQKELDTALALLKSGKTFADLDKQKNADLQVVTQTISSIEAAPALVSVLNKIKVGDFSQVLTTPGGLTVVKLLSLTPKHVKPFDEVKSTIERMLVSQKVNQLIAAKNGDLSNYTYQNPTSLKLAAEKTGLTIQQSPLMSRQGVKQGPFSQQPVLDAAFSDDVLVNGNNSNPITLQDGSVMVLRVAKRVPSTEKPLANVQEQINAILKKQMAMRELGLEAYTITNKIEKGDAEQSLHWQKRVNATRIDPATNKAILAAAFSTSSHDVKTAELDSGYAIIKVTAIHPGDWSKAAEKERLGLSANVAGMNGQNEFQIYLHGLVKKAKVEIMDKKLADSWSV